MRKILFAITLTLVLTGCATTSLLGVNNSTALGNHTMNISADGAVEIKSRTLRGAPTVVIERADGTKIHIQSQDLRAPIQAILEATQ